MIREKDAEGLEDDRVVCRLEAQWKCREGAASRQRPADESLVVRAPLVQLILDGRQEAPLRPDVFACVLPGLGCLAQKSRKGLSQ